MTRLLGLFLLSALAVGTISHAASRKPSTGMTCEHGSTYRECLGGNLMVTDIILCADESENFTFHFKGPKLDEDDTSGDKQSPEGKVTVIRATGATTFNLFISNTDSLPFAIGSRPFLDRKSRLSYKIGTLRIPAGDKEIVSKFKCY